MTRKEIIGILGQILYESTQGRIDPSTIDETTDLLSETGLDSIEALDILLKTEESFNIQVEDEDMNRNLFNSVSTIVEYIETKRA